MSATIQPWHREAGRAILDASDRIARETFSDDEAAEAGSAIIAAHDPAASDDTLSGSLESLAALWEKQAAAYPAEDGGYIAAAAVRCCARELRARLADGGKTP